MTKRMNVEPAFAEATAGQALNVNKIKAERSTTQVADLMEPSTINRQPANMLAKILLTDDHAVVRKGLRAILEKDFSGWTVVKVSDGVRAVDLA